MLRKLEILNTETYEDRVPLNKLCKRPDATVVVLVVIVAVDPVQAPGTLFRLSRREKRRAGRKKGKKEARAARFNVFVISANSLAVREKAFVTDKRGPQCVN